MYCVWLRLAFRRIKQESSQDKVSWNFGLWFVPSTARCQSSSPHRTPACSSKLRVPPSPKLPIFFPKRRLGTELSIFACSGCWPSLLLVTRSHGDPSPNTSLLLVPELPLPPPPSILFPSSLRSRLFPTPFLAYPYPPYPFWLILCVIELATSEWAAEASGSSFVTLTQGGPVPRQRRTIWHQSRSQFSLETVLVAPDFENAVTKV